MLEEPTAEQVAQNLAYLKSARQDPLPWEDQGGPPTGPMAALTQDVMDSLKELRRVDSCPAPASRMERRRRRKAAQRRFGYRLALSAVVVFVLAFFFAVYFL